MIIVDAKGIEHYRSRLEDVNESSDESARSYFIAQRDNPTLGLFVGEPIELRFNKARAIALSRRLTDGAGRFAGVVTGFIDLNTFQSFYRQVNLGTQSAILLWHDSGAMVLREPTLPVSVMRTLRRPPEFPSGDAAFNYTSARDGVRRLFAVAHLNGFPLQVAVGRDEAVVLDPLRMEALRVAARTLILSLLGGLAIAGLVHQLRRVERGARALRESEERYALAMEGASEGHFGWNYEEGPSFVSSKMKELLGLPADAPAITRPQLLVNVHPDDGPVIESAMRDHVEGRTPRYEMEYRVRHPDGEWHWLQVRGQYLRDASGKPLRLVGSAIDVTARKHAEAEKERLELQLRKSQKMEAMGTLAGGIAHDFNNILGAILGFGELAQKNAVEGGLVRRYIDNVMQAGERAKALVERILAFSRSGMGRRVPFHIQSAVEEALDLLQASVPTRIRLVRQLEAGDARVIGDATGVHQIVMNLCTNAMQAIEGSGTITIGLEREKVERSRQLQSGTLGVGDYVRLSVADTGSGIDPHVLDLVFDPFFTTKPVGEGTGLGLSLVHGIVTELGGAIDVTTKPGAGACFRVYLPYSGEIERRPAPAARELERGNGETVLLVDDEPALVSLNEELLAELGYEPVGFTSSLDALRAFRAQPDRFDVVFTDETMPDMVGTEFARAVMDLRADIPVVLMSGYSGPKLARRAEEVGIREVLKKPLRLEDVAGALAAILTGPHSTARRAQDG